MYPLISEKCFQSSHISKNIVLGLSIFIRNIKTKSDTIIVDSKFAQVRKVQRRHWIHRNFVGVTNLVDRLR